MVEKKVYKIEFRRTKYEGENSIEEISFAYVPGRNEEDASSFFSEEYNRRIRDEGNLGRLEILSVTKISCMTPNWKIRAVQE